MYLSVFVSQLRRSISVTVVEVDTGLCVPYSIQQSISKQATLLQHWLSAGCWLLATTHCSKFISSLVWVVFVLLGFYCSISCGHHFECLHILYRVRLNRTTSKERLNKCEKKTLSTILRVECVWFLFDISIYLRNKSLFHWSKLWRIFDSKIICWSLAVAFEYNHILNSLWSSSTTIQV